MEQSQQEFLKCPICLEIAKEAVESDCCNSIFCEQCINIVTNKKCPLCRKEKVETKPNIVIRRMINTIKTECPDCRNPTTFGELEGHLDFCPKSLVHCKFPKCSFKSPREKFYDHIFDHKDELTQLCSNSNELDKFVLQNSRLAQRDTPLDIEPIEILKNSNGTYARLGETGVFYCKGRLEGSCNCCNGYCGPTNGCCCLACMKLTIAVRRLPKGYFVNRDGGTCKYVGRTIYCGRKFANPNMGHDGYCGPHNGPQCSACKILETQMNNRYSKLK